MTFSIALLTVLIRAIRRHDLASGRSALAFPGSLITTLREYLNRWAEWLSRSLVGGQVQPTRGRGVSSRAEERVRDAVQACGFPR